MFQWLIENSIMCSHRRASWGNKGAVIQDLKRFAELLPCSEAWILTCYSYEGGQKTSCLLCWQTCTGQAETLHLLNTAVGSSPQTHAECGGLGSHSSLDLMGNKGIVYWCFNFPQTAEQPQRGLGLDSLHWMWTPRCLVLSLWGAGSWAQWSYESLPTWDIIIES